MVTVRTRIVTSVIIECLQALILILLTRRISASTLLAPPFRHLNLRDRARRVPLASYFLWTAFLATWGLFVAINNLPWLLVDRMHQICHLSYYYNVYWYGFAKISLHLYVIERAHVVKGISRKQDKLYWINNAILVSFVSLLVIAPIYEDAQVKNDKCFLNVSRKITIPLIIGDTLANIFWIIQFLYPILKLSGWKLGSTSGSRQQRNLQRLIYRTGFATFLGCVTSVINLTQVMLLEHIQEAWITNLSFAIEVLIICMLLHSTTRTENDKLDDASFFPSKSGSDRTVEISMKSKSIDDCTAV